MRCSACGCGGDLGRDGGAGKEGQSWGCKHTVYLSNKKKEALLNKAVALAMQVQCWSASSDMQRTGEAGLQRDGGGRSMGWAKTDWLGGSNRVPAQRPAGG